MPRGKRLVIQHLEGVSGKILEEYRDVVREMIKGKSGVYALYRKDQLYYVGLATNLMARLKTHLKDRHRGAWDRFSVYLTRRDDHMKELESLLLRIVNPKGNKVRGRFADSNNLLRDLKRQMMEVNLDKVASLIGGRVATQRRRKKARTARGAGALQGLVDRRMPLRGYRGDWEYRATLWKDGRIRYGEKFYDTPNSAARAALRKGANGWSFWRYRNSKKEWVPLRALKK